MRFDGLHSTNFTIAKYLSRNNDVYYIEHPYSITDYKKLDRKSEEYQLRKEGFRFFSNGLLQKKHEGVNILISRKILPTNFLKPGRIYNSFININEKIIASRINNIIKKNKITDHIFINAYNFFFPTLGKKINAALNIYYCVDPIPEYHKKHGIKNERSLVRESDIVICTSKALFNEKKKQNANSYFVPNGSDLVEQINTAEAKAHPALNNINGPVIGYIGAIERRIDYELLQEVIKINTDKNFVFTGPLYKVCVPDWFFEQKNIHFLPSVPYEEVPAMIFGFDVCMIPFKKDEISNCIFPLKLFEYLGIGKPVVVTDFNEDLKNFTSGLVEYASNANQFSAAIQKSLQQTGGQFASARIQLAEKNTWANRTEMISAIIDDGLRSKKRVDF